MKKAIWWFAILLSLSVLALIAWVFMHEERARGGFERLAESEHKIDALADALQIDMITVIDPDGRVFVVVRSPNESAESWFKRADDVQSGLGTASQNCETLHCTNGTVTICISCMVGETPDECQARLDHAVDVYCQTHTCTECK